MAMQHERDDGLQDRRRAAMSVLAHSDIAAIESRLGEMALPDFEPLRQPENGLVMVRGRIGGDGAPFNLGEAAVSRAAVRLPTGEVGFGYTLGRDGRKAQMIALCDALIQSAGHAQDIAVKVVAPLEAELTTRRRRKAEETAATKVDFYTLVRGEG